MNRRTATALASVKRTAGAFLEQAGKGDHRDHARARDRMYRASERFYSLLRFEDDAAERDRLERSAQRIVLGALEEGDRYRRGLLEARSDAARAALRPPRALTDEERSYQRELTISRG